MLIALFVSVINKSMPHKRMASDYDFIGYDGKSTPRMIMSKTHISIYVLNRLRE